MHLTFLCRVPWLPLIYFKGSIMYPAPEVTRNTFKAVAVTIEDFIPGLNEPLSSIGLQVKPPTLSDFKRKNKFWLCMKRSHFVTDLSVFVFGDDPRRRWRKLPNKTSVCTSDLQEWNMSGNSSGPAAIFKWVLNYGYVWTLSWFLITKDQYKFLCCKLQLELDESWDSVSTKQFYIKDCKSRIKLLAGSNLFVYFQLVPLEYKFK